MDQTRYQTSLGRPTAFSAHSTEKLHRRRLERPSPASSTSPSLSSFTTLSSASQSKSNRPKCNFCSRLGHIEAKCFLKEKLMRQIASLSSSEPSPASTSSLATPQSTPSTTQSTHAATASALSSIIQSESHSSWNADTGASAHMTFNRHWMRHMMPYHIPIHLADGSVLYSEGVGSVQFIPEVNGHKMAPLEFTNVLYVPSLSTNLFSVLYLTNASPFHCLH